MEIFTAFCAGPGFAGDGDRQCRAVIIMQASLGTKPFGAFCSRRPGEEAHLEQPSQAEQPQLVFPKAPLFAWRHDFLAAP